MANGDTPPGDQVLGPGVTYASNFSVGMIDAEITITVGVNRQLFVDGVVQGAMAQEWLQTIAMSPTSAKKLATAMTDVIASYEKNFGPIPQDPNFVLQKSGSGSK